MLARAQALQQAAGDKVLTLDHLTAAMQQQQQQHMNGGQGAAGSRAVNGPVQGPARPPAGGADGE